MNQRTDLDKPYYRSLTRSMVPVVVIVSVTPMILVAFVILYYFQAAYAEKVNAHLKELILKHRQDINIFLAEETSDLRLLAKTFSLDQLKDEAFLQDELFLLGNEHRGGFVDLGLINAQGRQVAYAGPFKLDEADYSDADWFKAARQKEVFISDVFLGLRGMPHFIICVQKQVGKETWLLRATIDFVAFNTLVENIRIGRTGFALIVNQANQFQTSPRHEIAFDEALSQRLRDLETRDSEGIQILTRKDDGGEYIYVSAALKNGEWLLIYRQSTADAFSIITKARTLAAIILVIGSLAIISMALGLSRRMVGIIARADREKEMMNQKMIQAGKLASIGELASGVAHEINNPVAIMVEEAGWIQDLLEDEQFSPSPNLEELNRALEQIRTQGRRCKEITHKLLFFARKTETTSQKLDLGKLIPEIMDLTRQRTKYGNVSVKTDISKALPFIRASHTQMQQVLLNLVNNAIDAMEEKGGTVTVRCRFIQDHIRIDVADTGPGIPEANLSRVFDPFFTTKPVGKGTGLGLSICYGIIRDMGGEIRVDSQLNQGTCFTITIPV